MRRLDDELWIVSRVYPPDDGGVQTYALAIARAYAALGWRVRVFAKSSAGPRKAFEDGIALHDVGGGSKAWVLLKLLFAVWTTMRREGRPAVVHATTWRSAIVPSTLGLAPLIVTVHGREVGRPKGLAGRWMHRVLRDATRVVAVSDWTLRILLARQPELAARCVVAWNGLSVLPPAAAQPPADELPLVLTACRLVPRKNLVAAIQAAARCAAQGQRFRYLIAGRGPEQAALQAAIDAAGAATEIRLLGYVSDAELAALYARCAVFLHPQIELEDGAEVEGFGIAVADAMAAGKTCIVGAAGGPAELIDDCTDGRVVDGRHVEAIAAALAPLLQHPDRAREMGEAARLKASRFSWHEHCLKAAGAPAAGQDRGTSS